MGPSCRAQARPSSDSGPDNKHSACLLFSSLHLSLSVSFTRIVPLFGNYAARFNYDNSSERRSDNGKRQLQTKTSENATLRFLQLTWLQFAALLPAAVVSSV